ncbi:MAG: prepilin peptidase [Victivallales bacterium]|nr:prepilin peptidase [Victivallales bacterium]
MPNLQLILTICIITPLLAVLCWYDCKYRRLPNALTLGLILLSLIWRLCTGGWYGFVDGVLGGLVCGAFILIPFLMRGAGGGDLKMIFGTGIATGLHLSFAELLFVSLTGVVLGLGMLVFKRVDGRRLKHYLRCVFDWRYDRKAGAESLPDRTDERGRVPFGVAIAIGTVITLCYAIYVERAFQ